MSAVCGTPEVVLQPEINPTLTVLEKQINTNAEDEQFESRSTSVGSDETWAVSESSGFARDEPHGKWYPLISANLKKHDELHDELQRLDKLQQLDKKASECRRRSGRSGRCRQREKKRNLFKARAVEEDKTGVSADMRKSTSSPIFVDNGTRVCPL
jgi:hypothetical protein